MEVRGYLNLYLKLFVSSVVSVANLQQTFRRRFKERVNNSRILWIKNAKFSGYYFYLSTNIQEDF